MEYVSIYRNKFDFKPCEDGISECCSCDCSALIQYLLAPNHRLETMISRYKTIMGWGRDPVIGVHVRRGDACAGWRNGKMHHAELMPKSFCLDVEKDVVPAIKLFSRVYSTKSVFISTGL